MIAFKQLTLRRGARKLLEGVNARFHDGQRVGIVGRNGTGKTSLFALITGDVTPDAGTVDVPRGLDIATVRQHTPAGGQPAIEFVLDGDAELRSIQTALAVAQAEDDAHAVGELHARLAEIDGYAATARAGRLLYGLGFAPATHAAPIDAFSGGWRMRLNLAAALMRRADVLLLDEPTNHLDLDAVLWLQDYLAAHPGAVLVISHDRDFLDAVTHHTLHLAGGRATLYSGGYSAFEATRAEAVRQQQAAFAAQQKRVAAMAQFVERFRAKATKARQAQSKLKAIERMQTVAPAHWDTPFSFSFLPCRRLPETLLRADNAAVGYGDMPLVSHIKLRLAPGDRIAILGRNGAGKSTVMCLLAGALAPMAGQIHRDRYLEVGYFAQHQIEALDATASAATHVQRADPAASEQQIRDFLGGFDFRGDRALAPIAAFSGGEKARLALALVVYARPNLLLLDEPTNHLDIDMRHALELALADYPGAVMLIAHDRHLIDATCERLWQVDDGKLAAFDGDLDDYHRWLTGQRANSQGQPVIAAGKSKPTPKPDRAGTARRDAAAQRAREKPLRQALQQAERDMQRLEKQLAEIEAVLAKPSVYGDRTEVARLSQEQGRLRKQLDAAEARWLDHAEALEAGRRGATDSLAS